MERNNIFKINKVLLLFLIGIVVVEYVLFNVFLPSIELLPLIPDDKLIEPSFGFQVIYHTIIATLITIALILYSKKLYRVAIVLMLIEFSFWVLKFFFIRNQYYISSELKFIELPNLVLIIYDFTSLLMRFFILYIMIYKKLFSLKHSIVIIFVSIMLLVLKAAIFSSPIFYFNWQ